MPPWPDDGSFLVGANLPWIDYGCDFGRNAWQPDGGLARPGAAAEARAILTQLAEAGARVVRWFALTDGRAGLRTDASGEIVGVDDRLFPDFDAAAELLRAVGLRAIFVLLDFGWFSAARDVNGVQTGGRSRLVGRRDSRQRLLDNVVEPILERYGQEPAILAWDIVNEPEWAVTWMPWSWRGRVPRCVMRAFIRAAVGLVHRRTSQLATVGLASAASLPLVARLGLDFYQVHWYDHLPGQFHPSAPVRLLGADRPVMLGEFPTRGSADVPQALLEAARSAGYAGAFAWSAVQSDGASDRTALLAGIRQFAGLPG